MARRWSLDEDAYLRRCYGSKTSESIAKRLDRTVEAVDARAQKLALAKSKRRFKGRRSARWTEPELKRLRRLYPRMSNVDIAHRLGRSAKSVLNKAVQLGLKKDPERLQKMGLENVTKREQRKGRKGGAS